MELEKTNAEEREKAVRTLLPIGSTVVRWVLDESEFPPK